MDAIPRVVISFVMNPSGAFSDKRLWTIVICVFSFYSMDNVDCSNFITLINSEEGDFCITNSTNAMFYDTSYYSVVAETRILPRIQHICDFERSKSNNVCIEDFQKDGWEVVDSLEYESLPIFDMRWETLPTRSLPYLKAKKSKEVDFETLIKIKSGKNFRITLSIKSEESHFLLCDSEEFQKAMCYWFVLQGWNNTLSILRRCEKQVVSIDKSGPKEPCATPVVTVDHKKDYSKFLYASSWSHLSFEKEGNTLTLKQLIRGGYKTLMSYQDPNPLTDLKYLMGHSKMQGAECKVHRTDYLRTTKPGVLKIYGISTVLNKELCLSIILTACDSCSLMVRFLDSYRRIVHERILQGSPEVWAQHKVHFSVNDDEYIHVEFYTKYESGSKQFWSIDHVRHCYAEEYRVTPKLNSNTLKACNLVGTDQIVIKENSIGTVTGGTRKLNIDGTFCDRVDSLGVNCIYCEILVRNGVLKSCEKLKMCDENDGRNVCYCSLGYVGTECDKKCFDGTFGYNCEETCGNCKNLCANTDGSCECSSLFTGNTCRIPKDDLVLIYPPTVVKTAPNSCQIEVKNNKYIGKGEPKYFLVQFAGPYQMDASEGNLKQWKIQKGIFDISYLGTFDVINLNVSSKYWIRVLIADSVDGVTNLATSKIPQTFCTTTCEPWTEKNVEVIPHSTTADISLHLETDKCLPKEYYWTAYDKEKEVTKSGNATYSFTIRGLIAFKTYHMKFIGPNTVLKSFITADGVPSKVRNITFPRITTSSIHIEWKVPKTPWGVIEQYFITYRKLRQNYCTEELSSQNDEQRINTTENYIELQNLTPFSNYTISIYAMNRENNGEVSNITASTKGLNHFEVEEEGINSMNITTKSIGVNGINFDIQNVDCHKLRGEINLSIVGKCNSDWCIDKNESQTFLSSGGMLENAVVVRGLQAYCEYSFSMSFCRGSECIFVSNVRATTKASVPNNVRNVEVIAKDGGYIALRWLPPYPPTGTLYRYLIKTRNEAHSSIKYRYDHYFAPVNCTIWPEYHCAEINTSIASGYRYSIDMEASNAEKPELYASIYKSFSVGAFAGISEKPDKLMTILTLDNSMEIFWNHPNKSEGYITKFIIYLTFENTEKIIQYPISKNFYKLTYNYKVPSPLPAATRYDIKVIALNLNVGNPATLSDYTYPPPPILLDPNIRTDFFKTSIVITFKMEKENFSVTEYERFVFFLISKSTIPPEKDPNLRKLEEKVNITMDKSLRLVGEVIPNGNVNFTIGEIGTNKRSEFLGEFLENGSLEEGRYYNVSVLLVLGFHEKYNYHTYNLRCYTLGYPMSTTTESSAQGSPRDEGNASIYLLLLLILIPILIAVVYFRKKIMSVQPSLSLEKILDGTGRNAPPLLPETDIQLEDKDPKVVPAKPIARTKPKLVNKKSTNPPNQPGNIYSKLVKMADFEEYVRTSIQQGEFERQHALFPRGATQPCEYGSLKVNKMKNRYNNLVAYDHTRVKLEKLPGDEYSDYINANYIQGYNMPRAYIATQGPRVSTLLDFWRMIWQENVQHIMILANIYENGKKKVEQYWPNINEELTFGDMCIQYQAMELFADFELRIFLLIKGEEKRKIEQLHFTTWPDHGVPLYPQSLIPFIRRLLKIPLSSSSPVVVHCSAGVGRTGTILLCDITLRMAAKEGAVDMLNNLQKLREQRTNMVDNDEQYKLAHLVVLECLMGLRTTITCNENMEKTVKKLIMGGDYRIQLNYLKETEWQDETMKSIAVSSEEFVVYPEKNRNQDIVPELQGRIYLTRYPPDDPSSSYINAVRVDGFRCPRRFIVTEQPMPNTVGDFWRLVVEGDITVIISLNDIDPTNETTCTFFPIAADLEMQPVDFITLRLGKVVELEYYDIYSIEVHIRKKKRKTMVELIAFKKWPAGNVLPSNPEEFLAFWEETDAISRRSRTVVVTCLDGVTSSGVYVALSFIIEKMKLEQECDVCLAVRKVRQNRRRFVEDEKQFIFLYEAALKYIEGFQSYANFQNQ